MPRSHPKGAKPAKPLWLRPMAIGAVPWGGYGRPAGVVRRLKAEPPVRDGRFGPTSKIGSALGELEGEPTSHHREYEQASSE